MQKRAIVRGAWLTALGAAVVAVPFIAVGLRPDGIANYYRVTLTPAGFALWFAAFIIATLSPTVIAFACWFGSKRSHYGWFPHLLLVPATYLVVRASVAIMLLAASEPDRDGLTGWATDPAAVLMLICPIAYFLALGMARLRRQRVPANRS